MGSLPDLSRRWTSWLDEEETITENEFKEITGDRNIQFWHGMDRRTAEFLAREHDILEYQAQYERRPIAEFLGASLPLMADPVSIATMPVGGTSITRAIASGSLRGYLRNTLIAGAKIGLTSAPIEAALQPQVYGELRPDILLGTLLGPVIAAPILAAPARVLHNIRSGPSATAAARSSQPETSGFNGARLVQAYEQDHWSVRSPPIIRDPGGIILPTHRFNEMFREYQGGYRQWVRNFARNQEDAAEFLRRNNIDPESPALREFIARHKEATVKRAQGASLERRFTQLRDLTDYVQGRATPEQVDRLRADRLLQEAQDMRDAVVRPGFERTSEDIRQLRSLEARERELVQLEEAPALRELAEVLKKPGFERTAADLNRVNTFLRRGAEGEMSRYIDNLRSQYEATLENLRQVDENLKKRKGRKPKAMMEERARLEAERARIAEELGWAREQLPMADGDVRVEDLMAVLDAASLESPVTAPVRPVPPGSAPPGSAPPRSAPGEDVAGGRTQAGVDKELAEVEAFARQHGVDVEEARAFAEELVEKIRRC
jgi:hypothetical protein